MNESRLYKLTNTNANRSKKGSWTFPYVQELDKITALEYIEIWCCVIIISSWRYHIAVQQCWITADWHWTYIKTRIVRVSRFAVGLLLLMYKLCSFSFENTTSEVLDKSKLWHDASNISARPRHVNSSQPISTRAAWIRCHDDGFVYMTRPFSVYRLLYKGYVCYIVVGWLAGRIYREGKYKNKSLLLMTTTTTEAKE